ncbi:hypothetical protein DFS34DRAFT_597116 [Phlyctochytrium arcticum]|nr:hypothetical protein DFS34DRAFT_597116 [Phlyctochytrium arcticum]
MSNLNPSLLFPSWQTPPPRADPTPTRNNAKLVVRQNVPTASPVVITVILPIPRPTTVPTLPPSNPPTPEPTLDPPPQTNIPPPTTSRTSPTRSPTNPSFPIGSSGQAGNLENASALTPGQRGGIIFGAIALFAIIAIAGFCFMRRSRKRSSDKRLERGLLNSAANMGKAANHTNSTQSFIPYLRPASSGTDVMRSSVVQNPTTAPYTGSLFAEAPIPPLDAVTLGAANPTIYSSMTAGGTSFGGSQMPKRASNSSSIPSAPTLPFPPSGQKDSSRDDDTLTRQNAKIVKPMSAMTSSSYPTPIKTSPGRSEPPKLPLPSVIPSPDILRRLSSADPNVRRSSLGGAQPRDTSPTPDDIPFNYTIQHGWIPQRSDEVLLESGDAVAIYQVFEDGWCEGCSERTGQVGMFPMACLRDPKSDSRYSNARRSTAKEMAIAGGVETFFDGFRESMQGSAQGTMQGSSRFMPNSTASILSSVGPSQSVSQLPPAKSGAGDQSMYSEFL